LSSGFQNIGRVPELQKRILFTFAMLAVYRLGCHIVTPGINPDVIKAFFAQMGGSVFGLFNLFSGGALQQLSIFALGIMPYISASIIFQLLTIVVPTLEQLQKEGESGRRKITQWTRYATVVIALFQSTLLAIALENGQFGEGAVVAPGWSFRILMAITLTTGTAFIMWLGEQITERGIGNGISLVIFAGIVVGIPRGLVALFEQVRTDQFTLLGAILLLGFATAFVGAVVLCERAQRRIPIQHARRVVGRKVMQGGMSYFPLRLNTAGVIPPIFASSILMFPAQIASFVQTPWMQRISEALHPGDWRYNTLYVSLIVFFCYFYTAVTFNPVDVADNMKKYGGFIPGIRPGKATAAYIDKVLTRITFGGAVYISAICVLPSLLHEKMKVPFYFGGTGLMIVVGVALDTVQQIESHLITRNYEGFTGPRGPRIRGRGGSGGRISGVGAVGS